MTKRVVAAAVLSLALCTAPARAKADVFELWGSGLIGGAFGSGQGDRDFFSWASGGAAGAEVGVRFLFLGVYVDYLRFFGGDAGANLMSFNLGGDGTVSLTDNLALVLRLAGTYYLGSLDDATRAGSDISSAQVNTSGVGVRGGVGLRYTFAKVFSFGTTPQIGYHYFYGGASEDIFDSSSHSHGWDVQLLGYFRIGFGI